MCVTVSVRENETRGERGRLISGHWQWWRMEAAKPKQKTPGNFTLKKEK